MPEFNTKISSPLPTCGPLDCPDVTLVFHINVSLLYMLFSRSLLKCYLLYHILHSSQVKDTNGLTPCRIKPLCVPGRYPGSYRYCHRRNKPIVAWSHFTRVWAALLAYMMRVWPMYGEKYTAAIMCSNFTTLMLGIWDIIGRGDNWTICMNTWLGMGAWTL